MTSNSPDLSGLLEQAEEAAARAYAPYSGVGRGAALLALDGRTFTGASLEFATFGGSVCAELAALSRAVGEGAREFAYLAVFPAGSPCGFCRQFLSEFGLSLSLVRQGPGGIELTSLAELLPESFGKESLNV